MQAKPLAALLVTAFILSACSGSTSTERDAMAFGLERYLQTEDVLPFQVTSDERGCLADELVDVYGSAELAAVGVTEDSIGGFDPISMAPQNGVGVASARCIDLVERFAANFSGGDAEIAACVAEVMAEEQVIELLGPEGGAVASEYWQSLTV